MAFDTTLLNAYGNEQSKEIFSKMFLGFETLDSQSIRVIDSVKDTQKLKFINQDLTLQAGGCGFNASSGDVDLSDKTFTVKSLKVNTELCENDLDGFSFEMFNNAGTNNGMEAELMTKITNMYTLQLNSTIETMFWQGVTGATSFEGIISKATADADVIDQVFDWTAATNSAADIIEAVQTVYNGLPATAMKDSVMYCGYDVYNKIAQAYINGLSYNINFDASSMMVPGTSMKLVRVNGLTGLNQIVATTISNLAYFTDLVEEVSKSRVWYSMDDQILKIALNFKAGADYFYGEYIVLTSPA